jgi:REP element-mobilizing transposase RayT
VARPPRILTAERLYHVTARGNGRSPILATDPDRQVFLATLRDAVGEYAWRCHAYCLMDTHYHLLLETPSANLPDGMQWLNGTYGTRFNAAYERSGHVFQGRYDARLIRSHAHALEVSRYIPLNPVRAGRCADPSQWPWSSFGATIGATRAPTFLSTETVLGWFGGGAPARSAYRMFVLDGKHVDDPRRAALSRILEDPTEAQIRYARDECGYALREIATHLGVHHTTLLRRLRNDAPKGV